MIQPIKIVIKKVKPVITYISDLPKYFNAKFQISFVIKNLTILCTRLKTNFKNIFEVNTNASVNVLNKITPISKIATKCSFVSNLLQKLITKSQINIETNTFAHLKNCVQVNSNFGFISRTKAVVTRFVKHYEVNNNTVGSVCNLSCKDFMTIEIA